MSCYKPLVFQKLGKNKETGKEKVLLVRCFSGNYEDYRNDKKFVFVPCGQCLGCRLDYANTWAERCCLEASIHGENNMFITLTYNELNCPTRVSKNEFKRFIKRLRYHFGDEHIKYFGCGEYGSRNHRPHYHIIIFGARFDDMKIIHRSSFDNTIAYYSSDKLNKLWPYGFTTIGEVNYNTASYTARYILKKQKGINKTDEFVLMSTRPAIGREYFEKNIEKIKENQLIYFPFNEKKKTAVINKYFKKLLLDKDLEYTEELKQEAINRINRKFNSDKFVHNIEDDFKFYQLKENIKKEQIKNLKRGL